MIFFLDLKLSFRIFFLYVFRWVNGYTPTPHMHPRVNKLKLVVVLVITGGKKKHSMEFGFVFFIS